MSMNWDDLRLFLVLAREGSMTAASKSLCVTHSTISRRLAAFESTFRVRLFERVPGGVRLTEAGEALHGKLLQMEHRANDVERFLVSRDHGLSGPIIVSTSGLMLTSWLAPYLKEFSEIYPDIELRLVTSSEIMSLAKREIDVALRFTKNPPETATGRKILPIYFGVYGSKEYLSAHEPLGDLSMLDWIGAEPSNAHEEAYLEENLPGIKVRMRISNLAYIHHMVQVGAGIGLISLVIGESDPTLVCLKELPMQHMFDLWLLTHADLQSNPRIRVFLDFISDRLRTHAVDRLTLTPEDLSV